MTKITGYDAIKYAIQNSLNLNKFADPTESAIFGLSIEEAIAIVQYDPSLIWIDTEIDREDGSNIK